MAFDACRNNPNFGRGTHRIDDDTPSLLEEERALQDWLDGLFAKPGFEWPRPPSAALEIAELTRRPKAQIEDVVKVLERDPLLAGSVLRLANSALAGPAGCSTLKQALIRLGLERVRDVVMEAAMLMTVMRAPGFEPTLERIRRHSVAVAWLSRTVARLTSMESENAFLIGLLHDVGLSVGVVGVCEFLNRSKKPPELTPARWLVIEQVHERFTDSMLQAWGLPMQVRIVARHHHSLMVDGHAHPSVAILLIAEKLAVDAGWGVTPAIATGPDDLPVVQSTERGDGFEYERAVKVLGLSERQCEALNDEAVGQLETLGARFKSE